MKHYLIAAATVVTAGTAMAQSGVQLYGRIDSSLASEKIDGVRRTHLASGLLTTSRWGFRGSEALGGGLRARFQLESALNADTGAGNGAGGGLLFDRQSWVGLSGGFGAVKFGRSDTAFDDIRDLGVVHALWDSEFSPPKIAYAAGVGDYSSRASNQLRYESPSLAGLSFGVSHGLDEQPGARRRDVTALNLRYRSGPLDIGLGHQRQAHEATPASDREFTTVAAAYKLGSVRLSGGFQRAENGASLRDHEFTLGAATALGAFELSAGYAWSESENAAGTTAAKGQALALGATYALSKRSRVYAALLDGEIEDGTGRASTDRRLLAVGVRHDF